MTTLTTDISHAPARVLEWLKGMSNALAVGFEAHAHHASRRDKIEALEAKSDEELASMGLRRDDIVHHVYRDLFYV
ncbi:hypothetical protein BXY70_2780 [Roseovarius halotolerans]|uniref:DUF1127 domain-containing protein n=1 Tax=Roseovarius halotolerans TaxID=505353 RepID=A0A1X6ZF81_9RHOB|nr:hypothetical protein [Roseovarius halotolerans]RKT30787.1 hypothetical protein BXY70_2780 [Roseovarius halotolerans]SLN49428.1 hypothetical protein ROH8110_02674 [Roseovarius halotolerans]